MPKPEPAYFVATCGDAELSKRLRVCENSEYRVARGRGLGTVTVFDGDAVVLHAVPLGSGTWFAWLHRAYHRHPLGPPFKDDSSPGAD